jgi:hypothetical protein
MTDDRAEPTSTAYTIAGPAGLHRGRSPQRHPHTIAAEALRTVTGTPWQRIEYRELERGPRATVWEVEGMNDPDTANGPYRLTIGDDHPLAEQQRADLVTARGTLRRAAHDPDGVDYEAAASMLDRVAGALCPHDLAEHHTAPDVTTGRPLTTCYACGLTWYADYPERLRPVTNDHDNDAEGQS